MVSGGRGHGRVLGAAPVRLLLHPLSSDTTGTDRDARLRRLTRYRYNNVPTDAGGRYLYLRDDADGDYWSPSWQPVRTALEMTPSAEPEPPEQPPSPGQPVPVSGSHCGEE